MQQIPLEGERFTIVNIAGKTRWIGVRKSPKGKGVDVFSTESHGKEKRLHLEPEEFFELKNLLNAIVG